MKPTKRKADRILLVLVACIVVGIVALADWQLEKAQVGSAWRDCFLYNICLWVVLSVGFRNRLGSAKFRGAFFVVLALHWLVSAIFTHVGLSFLWSGALALCEVIALSLFWQRICQKADRV
jgi:hypothetical protein